VTPRAKLTFLGTGTSHGVPMIGCRCEVCLSGDRRDARSRSSALLEYSGRKVLIDAGPDLRLQALAHGIDSIDALLLTHAHADHVGGLDDLRVYTEKSGSPIPLYGPPEELAALRGRFEYIFAEKPYVGGGIPKIDLRPVTEAFDLFGRTVEPVPIIHGEARIYGYRLGEFAYVCDASRLPADSMERLKGLGTLVINALRHEPHPTHFSLEECLEAVRILAPRRALLTHISHRLGHKSASKGLPLGVEMAYDGLSLDL